jgi:D-serine deaminase-like pyridoxal phosphate-dependent protein
MNLPALGCDRREIDTPALCLDLDAMQRNMASMMAMCGDAGVAWRPHTKSHKSPQIAHQLIEVGAIGITCAKLGEAEIMAAGGIRDILIANMIVGKAKLDRLFALRQVADPAVCVDHADQIAAFVDRFRDGELPLRILIEVDIGLNRVGSQPGEATLLLARQIADSPGIELAGIMGYEGHLLTIADLDEKAERIAATLSLLVEQKALLEGQGIPCPIVSCGGTGSFAFAIKQPGITEVQAGGGILMDAFYRRNCRIELWDYALTVETTVVSRPAADRAIIDAGRKTMDANHQIPIVLERPGVEVDSLSAEHGILRLASTAQDLAIGDRLSIVPGYSDLTCVLHDHLLGFRNDRLEVVLPVAGRGRLQ